MAGEDPVDVHALPGREELKPKFRRLTWASTQPGGRQMTASCGAILSTRLRSSRGRPLKKKKKKKVCRADSCSTALPLCTYSLRRIRYLTAKCDFSPLPLRI